jgi:hypothetical protein
MEVLRTWWFETLVITRPNPFTYATVIHIFMQTRSCSFFHPCSCCTPHPHNFYKFSHPTDWIYKIQWGSEKV